MSLPTPLTSSRMAAKYRAAGLWGDVTIAERFSAMTKRFPNKVAIAVGDERTTYTELLQRVGRVAAGLVSLGLEPGDVVAAQLPNGSELPTLHLACNLAGLLFMPLHDSWRALEVEHLLSQARVRVVVTPWIYRDFDHAAMIVDLRSKLPELREHFTLGGARAGARDLASLGAAAPLDDAAIASRRPDPDLPAAIMLSGGTTAISKISRYSSNNLLRMLEAARDAAGFGEADVAAALAPAGTGATGYVYPILMPLLNGATSIVLPRWGDPAAAADLLARERCSYAVAIPAQLVKIVPALRALGRHAFEPLRVVTNAGAPLPYETAVEVEELTGAVIQSIYGATDGGTPTMTRADDPRDKRLRTVGRVVWGCDCELRDPEGQAVAAGETGEIVWRGPDKSWGYLDDDAQTAAAFTDDNFYRSGDLGQFDDQGYLRVVGRIKDMILRGGRNVSPLAIEEALIRHPDVADVAVAPMPDPVLGERACAFVITREQRQMDLPEVVEFLKKEGLAVWQLPERLELMEEFPRSAGGKTLKRELTSVISEKLKLEESS